MKLIKNEEYYKLKCIEYFSNKELAIVVCGDLQFTHIIEFYKYENMNLGIKLFDIRNWKELFDGKESIYRMLSSLFNRKKKENKDV